MTERRVYSSTGRARAAEATKQAIVEAARSLIEAKGYETVSVRDIASTAGFSTGAIYRAFGDKASVYKAAYGHAPISPELARDLLAVAVKSSAVLRPERGEHEEFYRHINATVQTVYEA